MRTVPSRRCPNSGTHSGRSGHWRGGDPGGILRGMITNALKLVVSGALLLMTSGAWPNARYGAAIAIGLCIVAAVTLHFVAP